MSVRHDDPKTRPLEVLEHLEQERREEVVGNPVGATGELAVGVVRAVAIGAEVHPDQAVVAHPVRADDQRR